MKNRIILLTFLLGFIPMLNAQWTSPGDGTTYTIEDLVELSNGCVIWSESNNSYRIENDVTISANDKLDVNHSLNFGNNVTLTIKGSIEAINMSDYYWFSFSGNYGVNGRIRLEDALLRAFSEGVILHNWMAYKLLKARLFLRTAISRTSVANNKVLLSIA